MYDSKHGQSPNVPLKSERVYQFSVRVVLATFKTFRNAKTKHYICDETWNVCGHCTILKEKKSGSMLVLKKSGFVCLAAERLARSP